METRASDYGSTDRELPYGGGRRRSRTLRWYDAAPGMTQPEEEPRRRLRARSMIPASFPEIAISKSIERRHVAKNSADCIAGERLPRGFGQPFASRSRLSSPWRGWRSAYGYRRHGETTWSLPSAPSWPG